MPARKVKFIQNNHREHRSKKSRLQGYQIKRNNRLIRKWKKDKFDAKANKHLYYSLP
jgi:hypothetical protein